MGWDSWSNFTSTFEQTKQICQISHVEIFFDFHGKFSEFHSSCSNVDAAFDSPHIREIHYFLATKKWENGLMSLKLASFLFLTLTITNLFAVQNQFHSSNVFSSKWNQTFKTPLVCVYSHLSSVMFCKTSIISTGTYPKNEIGLSKISFHRKCANKKHRAETIFS